MHLRAWRNRFLRTYEKIMHVSNIGRKMPVLGKHVPQTILVFAAHPDDDVLGLGITLQRCVRNGQTVQVVFTTNGCDHGRSKDEIRKVSSIRYKEACDSLALIDIQPQNVSCLGYLDGRLYRYLPSLAQDILYIVRKTQPSLILVHTIEGGHRDHDVTSFVVQSTCKYLNFTDVYEWAEYNNEYPIGSPYIDFPHSPYSHHTVVQHIESTEMERHIKKRMLLQHTSQIGSMGFQKCTDHGEAIRRCDLSDLGQKLEYFWIKDKLRLQASLHDFRRNLSLYQPS